MEDKKRYKFKKTENIDDQISEEKEKEVGAIVLAFILLGLSVPTIANFPIDSEFPLLQADYISIIATELIGAGVSLKSFINSYLKKRILQKDKEALEESTGKHL